jgi:hypothetical protein
MKKYNTCRNGRTCIFVTMLQWQGTCAVANFMLGAEAQCLQKVNKNMRAHMCFEAAHETPFNLRKRQCTRARSEYTAR